VGPTPLNRTSVNWDGWYVGGHAAYSSSEMDFSHAVKSMTNFMLRNTVLEDPVAQWTLLSKNTTQSTGFGAFVGRNWQWDDLVFGFEANYSHLNSLQSSSTNSMVRTIVNPTGETPPAGHTVTYVTALNGNAALQIQDVVTLRSRAGWVVGNALPYLFGGAAIGRTAVERAATVTFDKYDEYDTTTTDAFGNTTSVHHVDYLGRGTQSQAERRANSYVPGWTAGLGMEYCLWGGIFMRGEWEYIRFMNVKNIPFSTNSLRFGLGYKF
jgi:outer membrane immunogenic protein